MGINEEIAKAFGAHGAWKTRIAQAIECGHSEHRPEDVAADDRCAFGKWLFGQSLPPTVRGTDDYKTVVRLHANFHKSAGSALSKALCGDRHGAKEDLATGSFAKSARSLSSALIQWQRNAATECSGYRSGSWRRLCFFWRGSVALRIWAAITIPVLAALAMAGVYGREVMETANGAERMERATTLLAEVAGIAHELQKERGLTASLVVKFDPAVVAKVGEQRKAVDRRREAVAAAATAVIPDMPDHLVEKWRGVAAALTEAEGVRTKVEMGSLTTPAAVVAAYTQPVGVLLAFEEAVAELAVRPDVARAMTSLASLSRAKEAAGQERAIGAAAITAGALSPVALGRLIELGAAQAERFSAFEAAASHGHRQILDQMTDSPVTADFFKMRIALKAGAFEGMTGQDWFRIATARIDALYDLEHQIVTSIRETARIRKESARGDVMVFSGLTVGALAIGGLLVFVLARGITGPTLRLTQSMRTLAEGQTRIDIPATDLPDEIGDMARAVLVFQQQALAVEQMTADAERHRRESEEARRASLQSMANTIEDQTGQVVTRVAEESERVGGTAKQMARSALCVQDNSQRVAAAAEQSLANAQAVAGASEELTASIREIATQVERSMTIVSEAVAAADNASLTVGSLAEAMVAIDQVVQVIAQIANQTNLLALNATIEAARAGDAGKGFAVVAHEVKNLANQTARQTEDITARITTLKAMAERVTGSIGDVVGRIRDVEEIAGSVAAAVDEQDAATKEISRNVQQSALAAQEVTERIVAVANEASATGRQADLVQGLLAAMAGQVAELGHVLTKVVRTASPDVNRRAAPRHPIKATVRLACDNRTVDGELADISAGGARVVGIPSARPGQACTLNVGDLRVPVTVIDSMDGTCRMRVAEGGQPEAARLLDRFGLGKRGPAAG